jgi:isopentenyl-diphosphate delta-isomerase
MTSSKNKIDERDRPAQSNDIKRRKLEHLKIPIEYDVQHKENYFDDIRLLHHSVPEVNFEEIDLSIKFFNKSISAPICITAITGGHPISKKVNETLAKAAEEENIIMSVGSQRAGLIDQDLIESFNVVREVAPTIPIIGNIGIGQISDPSFNLEEFRECIDMINADVMAIHFNALHELIQEKGDISYKDFNTNFKLIRKQYKIPIIAKEVGTGISYNLATDLDKLGFDGFDVGGTGGTSFAAIEQKRNTYNLNKYTRNPGEVFRDWGIPTPVSILYVRSMTQKPIIATGGLRTGIDIAKSIALGADLGGFAYKFLLTSWKDIEHHNIENTLREIRTLKHELRSSMWLMNVREINQLKLDKQKYVILGKLFQWLNQ